MKIVNHLVLKSYHIIAIAMAGRCIIISTDCFTDGVMTCFLPYSIYLFFAQHSVCLEINVGSLDYVTV